MDRFLAVLTALFVVANGRGAEFALDEDFSVTDEAGGSPAIEIERTSVLSHGHGAICEGGYTVLIDGNRHWLAMPPVTDFRLESDYSLYLYKMEFGLGYDIHFRRDPVKGGGHRLRVWWDEHEHKLHVFLDEKLVHTGGKKPENLDDLRLVLDVKGSKGVLETVGETVAFDIPGEVTAGKIAFDMPYSGSNQITFKRIRLTSDTAPEVTHVKDWRFVLSDEKGMPEPPVFDVSLDRYATGESLLKVSLDGMLMGRKPRLESGGKEWGKMLERITTPYLRIETAAGEVANLMLWNGRRQYSDPYMMKRKGTEGLSRGAKAADQQWPVRRSYVFTRLPESFALAAGFEYYMNHPYRFNGGGPFEQVRSYDGALVFEGESVRRGNVAFRAKSPEDKRIVSKIPKTVFEYEKALRHAQRQHYFYESEPVEFELSAVYRAADFEKDEVDLEPRLETIYREPTDAELVETKRELKPLAEGLVALVKGYRLAKNPGVGVWHLETMVKGGRGSGRDVRTVFEVLSDDPNGPCPPQASGLPVFMCVPNELKYREEGAFDPWSDRGGASHYYTIDDYYPVVGVHKRVWELLPIYRRQWWAQTSYRNAGDDDPYDTFNTDIIRHADYVYLRDLRNNPRARYDFTQVASYKEGQLRILKEFADLRKPPFKVLTPERLAKHVADNTPITDEEFLDLFDTCWEEFIDFARPRSDEMEQPFVDYLLSVNPKIGRASYGPMAVYTSAYKSPYWLRNASMPVERDPRIKANGSLWMFEEYHYSCDYPIYRASYFVQGYQFLHPYGRRIFPEIYYAGWGGRCNDGAVFQAHPMANAGLAPTHQRKIAYHYAYGSASLRDGRFSYWTDRGFHARNPEADTMDEFLHAWGNIVRNEPVRSPKAPYVMLDVAEIRRHGDYLETEGNFSINIGDQHYNNPGDVCNLADEALAYTYEAVVADGRATPVVSDLAELDAITSEMAEFVILPPIVKGCPAEKLAAIRRAWARGIGLLCFESCEGLEDVFGVKPGAERTLGAVGDEHFTHKMAKCRYEADGADVALFGAASQQDAFDIPVVFRNGKGGRRAVFVNVPPTVIRRHTFRGRYTRGQPAISVTLKRAMQDAFAFLSPAPAVRAEHGNALAAYTADGSLVVVVCEESPIYRDTNVYPIPFRLTVEERGIGARTITADTPYTVVSKTADKVVLRVETPKDTALFFKFAK